MPGTIPGSLDGVPTLIRDPQPVEFDELLKRRRTLGQDVLDEVWEGVYHVNPAPTGSHARVVQQLAVLLDGPARSAGLVPMLSIFNLGEPDNYRVPDGGLLRDSSDRIYYPTAALVVEVVSPDDQSWEKAGFYAAHKVEELLIVEPAARVVHWLGLADDEYQPLESSRLIDLDASQLAEMIDWPT